MAITARRYFGASTGRCGHWPTGDGHHAGWRPGGHRRKPSGTTPVTLILPAGVHTVELHGTGPARTISVNVVAGTEVAQYVELPKGGPAPGQLQVRTEPAGARVTVDGVPRGASPVTIGDLTPGPHAVALESDSGSSKQTVTISKQARRRRLWCS